MTKIKIDSEIYFAIRILDSFYSLFPLLFKDLNFKKFYLLLLDYLNSKYPKELEEYDILDTEMYFVVNK